MAWLVPRGKSQSPKARLPDHAPSVWISSISRWRSYEFQKTVAVSRYLVMSALYNNRQVHGRLPRFTRLGCRETQTMCGG